MIDTQRKTVLQIVEETVAAYTLSTRASSKAGTCCYVMSDGRMCAVGRCAIDPRNLENALYCVGSDIDQHLKHEYRGHSPEFWSDLQDLHDSPIYWNEAGISDDGRCRIKTILQNYGEVAHDD